MRKLLMNELERKSTGEFQKAPKFPLVLILDNVRSMMNIGSVFRTADGFLLESLWLCGITAKPPHREIQKTALGATETVAWRYFEKATDAVLLLKEQGYRVFALEQAVGSVNLRDFRPVAGQPHAIVLGNEVKGVDSAVLALCHGCLEIPQFGTKHSLNVAVAAGMVVWDFYAKIG